MPHHKIYFSPAASCTPATALIYEATNELIQSGDVQGWGVDFPVLPTDAVVYSEAPDGDLNGILCCRIDRATRTLKVVLFYVELSSRRQGVFRSMWSELLDYAKEEGALRIQVQASPNNKIAEDILGKMGATPVSTRFQLEI